MGYKGNYIYINLLLFVSLPVHMASLWWQCRLWAAEPGGGAPNEALWGAAQAGAALGWGSSSRLWLCDDARGSPGFGMAEYVLMPCYQPWKTLLEWELGGVLAIRGRTWCSYSFKGVWPKKKKGEMAEDLCRAEILSGRGGSGIYLCIGCFAVTFVEWSMGWQCFLVLT